MTGGQVGLEEAEWVDLPRPDPPSLPRGLTARLGWVAELAKEPKESLIGQVNEMSGALAEPDRTDWRFKQAMRPSQALFPSVDSTILGRSAEAEVSEVNAGIAGIAGEQMWEEREVARLRSELRAAETKHTCLYDCFQEMEGRQVELLAELKAFQLEINQEACGPKAFAIAWCRVYVAVASV